jgi:hypothetical protein
MPFQKGNTIGNRKGKPKGCRDFALEFLKALKQVEKSERVNYLEVALRKSLRSKDLMKSILNKMLPDLSKTDLGGEVLKTLQLIVKPNVTDADK